MSFCIIYFQFIKIRVTIILKSIIIPLLAFSSKKHQQLIKEIEKIYIDIDTLLIHYQKMKNDIEFCIKSTIFIITV